MVQRIWTSVAERIRYTAAERHRRCIDPHSRVVIPTDAAIGVEAQGRGAAASLNLGRFHA